MAYTKYSLTPANNNAAPPDGAPEGMLPSAVNDTMRDMMAQIRDCGDGIRGGTYTMTAPVITGGSISGATGSFTSLAYSTTFTGGTGVINIGSGQFYKDSSGNIGIGMTNPSKKLAVSNAGGTGIEFDPTLSSTESETIYYNRSTSLYTSNRQTALEHKFLSGTSPTERMRIDSSGNVGIGTNNPSAYGSKLVINSNVGSIASVFTDSTNYTFEIKSGGSTVAYIGGAVGSALALASNGIERIRISADGEVLIGRTALYYGAKTSINFDPSAQFGLVMYMTSSTYTNSAIGFVNPAFGIVGSISCNGSNTSYNTSSDYRLKENIAPMTGALDTVAKLKPVTYTWKADGSDGQGFIAHELQEVVPDCVTGEKDGTRIEKYEISPAIPAEFDEDGKVIKEEVKAVIGEREVPFYQSIDTSFLVATLTAAIQEQQAMINELKAKVAALEAA